MLQLCDSPFDRETIQRAHDVVAAVRKVEITTPLEEPAYTPLNIANFITFPKSGPKGILFHGCKVSGLDTALELGLLVLMRGKVYTPERLIAHRRWSQAY